MLFIISRNERGLRVEQLERHGFGEWIRQRTAGVRPGSHPVFVDRMPERESSSTELLLIEGRVIVPRAVEVVKTYSLD